MIEVCHELERYPQPQPYRNAGGDCFACAVTATLPFLYPELERTSDEWFEYAFESFRTGKTYGSDDLVIDNTFRGMKSALDGISRDLGRLEVEYDMVEPHFHRATWRDEGHHGWPFQIPEGGYTRRLEGYLRGGWVAFATVNHGGGGPTLVKDDGSVWHRGTDHFIVLDGVRLAYETTCDSAGEFQSGSWNDYLHVVDSSATNLTDWYRTLTFLLKHGACSWWLARRDVR